jgi:hypothetical protein
MILKEMNTIAEGCPTGLPCPIAAASELKDAGASPEEMLDWVAKLTQELLSPIDRPGDEGEGASMELPGLDDLQPGESSMMMSLPEEV